MSGAYFVLGDVKGGKIIQRSLSMLVERKGLSSPRVLYLGAASYNNRKYRDSFEKGLSLANKASVFKYLNLSIHMPWYHKDIQPERIEEKFQEADIIFFDGGGVKALSETFNHFSLADHITKAHERGAYIGGMCAGGSFLGKEIVFWENGHIHTQEGANLIEGTAISCHMDRPGQGEARRLYLEQALEKPGVNRAIGLYENQTVLFEGEKIYSLSARATVAEPFSMTRKGDIIPIAPACG